MYYYFGKSVCLITVVQLRGNFHEVAHRAQSITGLEVASLQEQYNQHCLRECPRVIKDPSFPPASLFPQGGKYLTLKTCSRITDSFFLWATWLLKTQNHMCTHSFRYSTWLCFVVLHVSCFLTFNYV